MFKKKMQSQKGQILILSVILLPLFLIMSVLIIEAGFLYVKQSQLQNAADAIVLADIADVAEDVRKAKATKIVSLNRTVDFNSAEFNIPDDYPRPTADGGFKVKLTENVIPIFGEIFGTGAITSIEVRAQAKDGKLVRWSE